ncbi:MAG TPA: glucosamine-6-phosphate deaminase, partial [Rubrobacter sp.]|nr:glucosamine-6-phosphate deaminase [Rubrobacter sp.]
MRAHVYPDYGAMSAAVADAIARMLRDEHSTVFLLPTGTTPLGMYRRLVEMYRTGEISFSGATFFNLDEYLGLPPDHPASYHVYMKENFY